MPTIEFLGDWDADQVREIIPQLQKSLDMDSSGLDDLTPTTIAPDLPKLLPKKRRKLIDLLRQASSKALEKSEEPEEEPCDESDRDWSAYKLGKAIVPDPSSTDFDFPVKDGEYGAGVYLATGDSQGDRPRIRVRIDAQPDQIISPDKYEELTEDLTQDADLILDGKGVRAIATLNKSGSIDSLCVRHVDAIEPLGMIGEGVIPFGSPRFQLVAIEQESDHLIADLEVVDRADSLAKSASVDRRSRLQSKSHLNGTKLIVSHGPQLDRKLVRDAIQRVKLDASNSLLDLRVCLSRGKPDFLPGVVHAFCLPSDGTIHLCPHDPREAIASLVRDLSDRLQAAVKAGAVPPDVALQVLTTAAQITPQWWIEMLIKRYAGAIAAFQSFGEGVPPDQYMGILVSRGFGIWGNRRLLMEAIAEDYRVAHDPAGLPNLVCLEFDLAVPALARAGQQALIRSLDSGRKAESGPDTGGL